MLQLHGLPPSLQRLEIEGDPQGPLQVGNRQDVVPAHVCTSSGSPASCWSAASPSANSEHTLDTELL